MSNVIPIFRGKKVILYKDPIVTDYSEDMQKARMKRIQASLARINQLMQELQRMAQEDKQGRRVGD